MSFNNTRRYDPPKRKRVLIGETLEEETVRLAKEIAAHPVTKCEPGARNPSRLGRAGAASRSFRLRTLLSPRGLRRKSCASRDARKTLPRG